MMGQSFTPLHAKQQGAALVVAMLILSIVVLLAGSFTVESNFNFRRVSNQIAQEQAYQYLRATEAIAHHALRLDLEEDERKGVFIDKSDEFWAQETLPFEVDGGSYGGKLTDLLGRFNINSLQRNSAAGRNGNSPTVPSTTAQRIFIRLLQTFNSEDPDGLQVSSDEALEITRAIVDFIDGNQTVTNNAQDCGEDDAYQSIEGRKPHKTADQIFHSVSQLRLVCNMKPELFEALRKHITVWPLDNVATLNLHSASDELLRSVLIPVPATNAAVTANTAVNKPTDLESVSTFMNKIRAEANQLEGAQSIIAAFQDKAEGYENINEVIKDLKADGYQLMAGGNYEFTLRSDYFLLSSKAVIGDVQLELQSVLYREANTSGSIKVLARSLIPELLVDE